MNAKDFQRLKTFGSAGIAASMSVFVCGLQCGASLLRLELEDHLSLIWQEVSVLYLAMDPVEPMVAISRKEKAILLLVLEIVKAK